MAANWKASSLMLTYGHFLGGFRLVLWIFCLVVLLPYDVELNPGPVRYPCVTDQFVSISVLYSVMNVPVGVIVLGYLCL